MFERTTKTFVTQILEYHVSMILANKLFLYKIDTDGSDMDVQIGVLLDGINLACYVTKL